MKAHVVRCLLAGILLFVVISHSSKLFGQNKTDVEKLLSNYRLVWQDEFNGRILDTSKWSYRADNAKRNYAWVDGAKTISIDGMGHAVIRTILEDGKYYVGQLSTDGHFDSRYGYYECRAKMNKSIGSHIAFWLQSPTESRQPFNHTRKNGAEIDIFEYHRKAPKTVWQTIHINGYGQEHQQNGRKIQLPDIDTGFHTFGLLWTKDSYAFYIDGKKTWETSYGISNRTQFIILSTELTGFGGDPSLGQYPDSVLYDYVRVYKAL